MLIAKHHLPVFDSEHIPMASAGCGGNGWTDHDVAEAASPRIRAGSKRVAQAQYNRSRITENFQGLRLLHRAPEAADLRLQKSMGELRLQGAPSKAAVCGRAFTTFCRSCLLQLLLQLASYCLVVAAVGFHPVWLPCSDVATSEHQIWCLSVHHEYPCR